MPDKAIVRLKSVASKLEDLARSLEGIEDHVSAPDFPPSERPDVGLINFRESILALAAEAEQFAEDYVFGDDPEHRLITVASSRTPSASSTTPSTFTTLPPRATPRD